jgi:hypothetical protein
MKRALLLITFLAFPWPATVIPAFPAEKVWVPKHKWYEAAAKKDEENR